MREEPLLKVENLTKLFPLSRGILSSILGSKKSFVRAVDGVSFQIRRGEVLALAGESGSGKTTIGNLCAFLAEPTSGRIYFKGAPISNLRGQELKSYRRQVQMIFQNPYESLDPRLTVLDTITEPLRVHRIGSSKNERVEIVCRMLDGVQLKPPEEFLGRFPHELSGGQRQRVAIARSLVLRPEFIIADEPVSMLDVSVRSGIMNLMSHFKKEFDETYLFIGHDLSVARYMSDRIAIIYLGKILEIGPKEEIISSPHNPYTKILISAVPVPNPRYKRPRVQINARALAPSADSLPKGGCCFHPRCPCALDACKQLEPPLRQVGRQHFVACHLELS